jgi:hypothetical protein
VKRDFGPAAPTLAREDEKGDAGELALAVPIGKPARRLKAYPTFILAQVKIIQG